MNSYNALKAYMQGDSAVPLSAGQHMLAAAESGEGLGGYGDGDI